MSFDLSQYHQVFFEESFDHLANMESALLQLEGGAEDPEVVNIIFRGAHSIKGGGATFGFQAVAEFTHIMETLLEQIRSGKTAITSGIIAMLLKSVDALRDMINALQSGDEADISRYIPLQQELCAGLAGDDESPADEDKTTFENERTSAPATAESSSTGWHIQFCPYRNFFQTGNDPHRILNELSRLGPVQIQADVSSLPDFMEMDPDECYLTWNIALSGQVSRSELDEIFAWVESDCDLYIRPLENNSQGMHSSGDSGRQIDSSSLSAGHPSGQDRKHGDSESIRVSIEKIDAIINMVGELVIIQSMLSEVGTTLQGINDVAVENLRDGLDQLERNTRELQEGVMGIRMLPISFIFRRFPRLVYDLGAKLGKKVELRLSGEQTELDKTLMEKMGDPLVHLVRNALDHGIEDPDTRKSLGKPETGQIHLDAYHQGGNIVIEVSDDGAGLDRQRIAVKARERGLLDETDEPDEERILECIFDPGFSTAESVSDVSGRGVGMDVVRRNIRDLGGSVKVSSDPGRGTRFSIRLPLTLAILDGQLVRVGDQFYVVPLVSIVESLQVCAERINAVAGSGEVYRLRDEYIPVMDLHRKFEINGTATELAGSLLVVVESEGKKTGLVVDELLGQQQVVIKSLETNYRPVACISGATILGDGTVALILDAGQLVNTFRGEPGANEHTSGKAIAAA